MKSIIFLVVGLVVGYLIGKNQSKITDKASDSPNREQTERKNKLLAQIVSEVEAKGEITNNEVEKMLGVSDATAERYLDELEKQGKLQQVGRVGRFVTYKKP